MFSQNFCPFPSQNFIGWESSPHPTYSRKNLGGIQQRFGETYSDVLKTLLYVPPKFLSFSHSKLQCVGKFPPLCPFFFFFGLLSLQVFHSFFFLIIPSFYFLFSQANFPSLPPLSLLHTQPPPATLAATTLATTHCHHHSFFPLFWCSSFFKV